MASKPNIVFMHSHNTGRHIQPYGFAAPTPNLQRMAEQGALFRRAFAAAPTCSPSRAGFLTGLSPHSAGMLGLSHRGYGRTHYPQHITHRLQAAGYHTLLCGIEHIVHGQGGNTPYDGYDQFIKTDCSAAQVGGAVADFIRGDHDKPFFISAGFRETHTPFPDPDPTNHRAEDERYCMPPSPLPDTPATRRDTAGFKASARQMDDGYGLILDALDDAGLADNTLVFAFADHGLQMPRNMCNLTDHGLGVYLIARGPGGFTGGRSVDAMVSLLDLVPTCCDLAGVEAQPCEGQSLLPLMRDETDQLHDALFGEITYHASYEPTRSVRTERYKYIRRYDGRDRVVLPNCDDCISKDYLLDQDWRSEPRDQEMLFDLVFDPHEQNNIAQREPDVLAAMRKRLDDWMETTDDPLRHTGEVPPPPGSKNNDPDGLSCREDPIVTPA